MSDDLLWQVFTDTGDPLCWLMHRAAENQTIKMGRGMTPDPSDEQGTYVQNDKRANTPRGKI